MIDGVILPETTDSCNIINEHFCTAGEKLATSIVALNGYGTGDIVNLYPEHSGNDFSFKPVDASDVVRTIESLPNKKSTGHDKVPMQLLKATVTSIAPIIAICFNLAVIATT